MVKQFLTDSEKKTLEEFVQYDLEVSERGNSFLNFSPAYHKSYTDNVKLIEDIFNKRNKSSFKSEFQTLGGEGELVFLKHFGLSLEEYFTQFDNSLHDNGIGGGDGGVDFEINGLKFDIKTTKNTFNGFSLKYFTKAKSKKRCDYFVFIRYDTKSRIYTILGYASWENVLSKLYYGESNKCWRLDTTELFDNGLLDTNINTILALSRQSA